MQNGMVSGPWEVFADGFTGVDIVVSTSDAAYRPMGLAQGPDGSLYVSDSEKGKIWRIMYKGDKKNFGRDQLEAMEKRKITASNIKTPDEFEDKIASEDMMDIDEENLSHGGKLFNIFCSVCHQRNGRGNDRFPPLDGTEWVTGDKATLIGVVLNGLSGEITVKGKSYTNRMPKLHMLKDDEIAEILTYVRQSFGNNASAVTPVEVAKVRRTNTAE
jgi:mono/diheme cytochrome c family protein